MFDQIKTQTANTARIPVVQPGENLTGLFDEMLGLMALMPAAMTQRGPLPDDDETEAMFDNMPV
jgi:hypothetical protein